MFYNTDADRSPTRKRRRGAIEKCRRDRINCSLDELKRLVPQALEKSGSAKLEKAEILQMTVDHLKVLHSNRVYDLSGEYKGVQPDTHRIASDYHGLGKFTGHCFVFCFSFSCCFCFCCFCCYCF